MQLSPKPTTKISLFFNKTRVKLPERYPDIVSKYLQRKGLAKSERYPNSAHTAHTNCVIMPALAHYDPTLREH